MKEEIKVKLLQQVASENSGIQKGNFQTVLLILNSIHYNRHRTKDEFSSSRLQDSNLLLQKILLNGYSMFKLISGIQIPNIEYNNYVTFNDPITLNAILRSLLETYLTFHFFNFAELEAENEIRYKIWSYFGLYNRSKIKITSPSLTDQYRIVQENDAKEMDQLLSEIKDSDLFLKLCDAKKRSLLEDLQRNWKIKFYDKSYRKLGYQDLLNDIGLRIEFYDNQYNYLSWATHTTSILIYQLRQMYDQSWDRLELHNCLIKACSLIAMSTMDLISNDNDYLLSYNLLSQEHKDLLNFYSYYFRGDNFTIDKIDV
jgi:hypothetical protein